MSLETPWTEYHIELYNPIEGMNNVYMEGNLLNSNPDERARYLMESFLDEDSIPHQRLREIASTKGLHKALNFLEELALEQYERESNLLPEELLEIED